MKKSIIDLSSVMKHVDESVTDKKKFGSVLNNRVRLSHLSPNRFDAYRYNTPNYIVLTLTRATNCFIDKVSDNEVYYC